MARLHSGDPASFCLTCSLAWISWTLKVQPHNTFEYSEYYRIWHEM